MVQDRILSADGMTIDYISVADPVTLQEVTAIGSSAVILLAVRLGSTRLIDNILVRV
jgi:pantoate--beta-alanine ligase